MAKATKPRPPQRIPRVGDKVTIPSSPLTFTVSHVSNDATEVTLNFDESNIHRFRVPVGNLTWVDKK